MASGKHSRAPSSRVLPKGTEEDDDVYHPRFEGGFVDLEEGLGGSEEGLGASGGASIGVSAEF